MLIAVPGRRCMSLWTGRPTAGDYVAADGEPDDPEVLWRALRDAHLGLVVTLAKHYTGHGTAFLDLIEIGNVGLAQAIRAYNPAKGYRFSIYATWWIRHAFARAITA